MGEYFIHRLEVGNCLEKIHKFQHVSFDGKSTNKSRVLSISALNKGHNIHGNK